MYAYAEQLHILYRKSPNELGAIKGKEKEEHNNPKITSKIINGTSIFVPFFIWK